MNTMTRDAFLAFLQLHKGALPVTLTTLTDARASKTGNPYQTIYKLNKVNGFIGFDYEKAVNRQREREGAKTDFEASSHVWGEYTNSNLIEKDGEYYIRLKIEREAMKPVYMYNSGNGLAILSKEKIERFLPKPKPSNVQGVEKEVVYRNYKLKSIVSATINGKTYKIR